MGTLNKVGFQAVNIPAQDFTLSYSNSLAGGWVEGGDLPAAYIIRRGSRDLGSRTLEGSRPGMAMLLKDIREGDTVVVVSLDRFARAWGVRPPAQPGLVVTEMTEGCLDGRIRAMYVVGENPLLAEPDLGFAVIATPNNVHFDQARQFVETGVPVFLANLSRRRSRRDSPFRAAFSAKETTEKSNRIISESMMLKVKNRSSRKVGSGTTSIAMINKTKAGKPKPAKSKREKFCRIADRVNVLMGGGARAK